MRTSEQVYDDPFEEESPETSLLLSPQQEQHQRPQSKIWWRLALSPLKDETGSGWGVIAGLAMLAVVGVALGLVLPTNVNLPTPWYRYVSNAVGYWYFSCWSVSFYPQVYSNFCRKTTRGLSADFCGLNVIGFACYSIYNICFFFSAEVQRWYKERHHDVDSTVQSNDVFFAVHAFLLSALTFLQIGYYDGAKALRPSHVIGWVMTAILFALVGYIGLLLVLPGASSKWLNFLYLLSYIKIFVSLIKYIPQGILNYRRKSTRGWSIWNILLDFTGGMLSDLQLIMDCADLGDWTGITGNLAKFGLGVVSIFFDVIFMVQHYILYPDAHSDGDQQLEADYHEQFPANRGDSLDDNHGEE